MRELDFTTLEKQSGSYVSDDLRPRADDVVWRVRWRDRWLYVYLLLEFQSEVDRFMAVRRLVCVGLLYQDLIHARQLTEQPLPSSISGRGFFIGVLMMLLDCAGKMLDLSQPMVMGVLNATPDSFSDGGHYLELDAALRRAEQMVSEGAAIIDVGGESTRPGAPPVSVQEELARVLPVVERLARELPIPVSIDTSKPEVMNEAARVGAGLINDVRALQMPGALDAAVASGLPVCLMHIRGEPVTMQQQPCYSEVVTEVHAFLAERVRACEAVGILRERVLVDPGFGFGKTLDHNLRLLRHLDRFTDLAAGVLVGISRKSMIGLLLHAPVDQRLSGSLAAAVIALWQGATIIRTHDVRETVQALCVCAAVRAMG